MAEEIKFKASLDATAVQKAFTAIAKTTKQLTKGLQTVGSKGLNAITKASKKALSGLKKIAQVAGKGLGLLGLGGALASVKGGMETNQKVADLFAKAMLLVTGTVNGLVEALEPLFSWLMKAFSDPKKAWDDLVDSFTSGADWIWNNIIKGVFDWFREGFLKLNKSLVEARIKWNEFTGDTEEANQLKKQIKEIDEQLGELEKRQSKRGKERDRVWNETTKAVTKFGETMKNNIEPLMKNSDELIKLEKNLRRMEIQQQSLIEQYDLQAEAQRQIRDDEFRTIEEREQANIRLGEILEEQATKEKQNLQDRINNLQKQQSMLGYNFEREMEILDLKKEQEAVDAKVLGFKSEMLMNEMALNREKIELQTTAMQGEIDLLNQQMETNILKATSEEEKIRIVEETLQKEYDLKMKMFDLELSQYQEGTQAYQDALLEKEQYLAEFNTKQAEMDADELERKKTIDKAKEDSDKAVAENKYATYMSAANAIKSLVGEDSKIGMGISIAQAIADTYVGATKAFAQGGVLGYVGAAGVIASGMANVKNIIEQANQVESLTGTSIPKGGAASVGPSMSLIGGAVNNQAQLMADLNQTLKKPARAFVVQTDVKSADSLDRRTQENATLTE
jgi:hypothetical protein